jgi:hypothetical protein
MLLNCINERGEALDADFEAVAGFDGGDSGWGAGEDDVAGELGFGNQPRDSRQKFPHLARLSHAKSLICARKR